MHLKKTMEDEENIASTFEPENCLENPRIEENENEPWQDISNQDGHNENGNHVQISDEILT
jgi:hypothetical protein